MTRSGMPAFDLEPKVAWSQRVLKVGGFIQLAFAAFWLVRGGLSTGGGAGKVVTAMAILLVAAALIYAVYFTAGVGHRPTSREAKRIERSVTAATVIELVASIVFPVVVTMAGHSDWVLPSIAITVGPLLLWLDHLVSIPRFRLAGWALTIGPFILVATMSGSSLGATTGLTAGCLLLVTAAAGFHDLSRLGSRRSPIAPRIDPQTT